MSSVLRRVQGTYFLGEHWELYSSRRSRLTASPEPRYLLQADGRHRQLCRSQALVHGGVVPPTRPSNLFTKLGRPRRLHTQRATSAAGPQVFVENCGSLGQSSHRKSPSMDASHRAYIVDGTYFVPWYFQPPGIAHRQLEQAPATPPLGHIVRRNFVRLVNGLGARATSAALTVSEHLKASRPCATELASARARLMVL